MFGEKIKIAVKNQDGVRWTIFPTEMPSSGFVLLFVIVSKKCHLG
jgi:hypothetical protein